VLVVFVVVAVLGVVAIGLVAVGAVTGRLSTQPKRSVFDLEEAVAFIAERLPDEATAQLSYGDVSDIVGWHLDYLENKGVAGESDHDLEALPVGPIVTDDDEGVAYVIGRAAERGLEADDVQVFQVLEIELQYLHAIGAVGGAVPTPVDPSDGGEAVSFPAPEKGGGPPDE
jgi:hypothetical protein